ncbi:MAG TPA: hypothetical protein VMM84_01250 [Pyrinomonadaceae bacterium]|nr:hypothetical protein [Pyrinomonadaceae bacterium]
MPYTIHQDVKLYDASLEVDEEISFELPPGRHAWIQVIKGGVTVNGTSLDAGDGAAISNEPSLNIRATKESEILFFDLS